MLCYVMLCYVMLCYVMLCYVMLCYVMLCYYAGIRYRMVYEICFSNLLTRVLFTSTCSKGFSLLYQTFNSNFNISKYHMVYSTIFALLCFILFRFSFCLVWVNCLFCSFFFSCLFVCLFVSWYLFFVCFPFFLFYVSVSLSTICIMYNCYSTINLWNQKKW